MNKKLLSNPDVKEIVLAFLKWAKLDHNNSAEEYDFFVEHVGVKMKKAEALRKEKLTDLAAEMMDALPDANVTPSGANIRSNLTDVVKKLDGFFKKYKSQKYTKEVILEATRLYGITASERDFAYVSPLNYFIEKDRNSLLASFCENVISGKVRKEPTKEFRSGMI